MLSLLAALLLFTGCKTREDPVVNRGPLGGASRPAAGNDGPAEGPSPDPEPGGDPEPPRPDPGPIDVNCPPDSVQYGAPPPDGQEVYCAQIVDGAKVKQGLYRLWKNSVLIRQGEFLDDKQDGEWIDWYDDGQQKSQAVWKEGMYQGPWKTWHENGELSGEGNYVDGKKDGPTRFFHDNGALEAESTYVNDLREGKSTNYFPSGKLRSEGSYLAGKKDGPWIDLDESGARSTSTYKDGVRVGP